MKKKIYLFVFCLFFTSSIVMAESSTILPSWATYNEGTVIPSLVTQPERAELERSLGESVIGTTNHFTGIGYFGEEGVIFYFDELNESGTRASSYLVNNPDDNAPDLMLREITYSNPKTGLSDWRGEAVEVWAVDYNGTGENILLANAYNRSAIQLATDKNVTLPQVDGAKVDFAYNTDSYDHYDTLIYFPEEFEYCRAIKLVDITENEELKALGGGGMNSRDGYDLDAIYGYRILDIPTENVEYQKETAISVGNLNLNCEDSWQKVVMKVPTSDLKDGNTSKFNIIAGQHYLIGEGEIYLDENGEVKVRYNFNASYNLVKVNDIKVGIYKNYTNILKNGKLLGNGQLTADEKVTLEDEYAYIRLHLDVEIPTYLIEELEYVDTIESICEPVKNPNNEGCHKEDNKKTNCDKNKCDKDKCDNKKHECNHKKEHCDNKIKDNHNDKKHECNSNKNKPKKVKKTNFIKTTCKNAKKTLKKIFH